MMSKKIDQIKMMYCSVIILNVLYLYCTYAPEYNITIVLSSQWQVLLNCVTLACGVIAALASLIFNDAYTNVDKKTNLTNLYHELGDRPYGRGWLIAWIAMGALYFQIADYQHALASIVIAFMVFYLHLNHINAITLAVQVNLSESTKK